MLYKHVLYLGLFLIIQKELPSSSYYETEDSILNNSPEIRIRRQGSPSSILVHSIPQYNQDHVHSNWNNPVQIPYAPSLHFSPHHHPHHHHANHHQHSEHLEQQTRHLSSPPGPHVHENEDESQSSALVPISGTPSRFDLNYDSTYEYESSDNNNNNNNDLPYDSPAQNMDFPDSNNNRDDAALISPPMQHNHLTATSDSYQDHHADPEIISERTQPDTSATLWDKFTGNVMQILPPAVRITSRYNGNQGCVGGTKCQFFLVCWMSGGSLGSSCGPLYTCCVTPSSQEIQPAFYGPVSNDPYCGRSSTRISRIVGGSDASFGQFPWQAFVQVGGSRCGGALVGPKHVVTAGHCVARSQHNPTSIRVTLGDYILHSDIESLPHEVFTVAEVRLHPNFRFTPQADRFDVAVLILDRNAHYQDNIKPICLPQKDASFLGRTSYVAGWGALQAGSKLRPKVLQHVAVPVIENAVCETWHRKRGINIRIHEEMMCAGHEFGGRDACQGDSGGPLMLNDYGVWYLIGIVSAGYSCAKQYQPGIYHRVSSSSDWISANVQSAVATRR